jgi:hypothetical protein
MVGLMRHRQTKGPDSARPYLNRRATPRLHLRNGNVRVDYGLSLFGCRSSVCRALWSGDGGKATHGSVLERYEILEALPAISPR